MDQITPSLPAAGTSEPLLLPLSAIRLPHNYRQLNATAGLTELAASLLTKGQLQAVLVRPLVGDEAQAEYAYELVFGNRRYAAHQLAGLPTITATQRALSADEAEELRLVENVQREDPHPADEARAVAKLAAKGDSRAEIAARLGKSPRWVAQRQALGQLSPDWFGLLSTDQLSLEAAEEISRWPLPVQQRLWGKTGSQAGVGISSVRYWLNGEQHHLSAAPWQLTDPTLVPAAGACHGCPKRSSCVAELFAPAASSKDDSCLDRACWATKLEAKISRLLAERSTDEVPAVRISERYTSPTANALPLSRYELVSKKKGAIPAVLVDGPHAGHGRYIKVVGAALVMSTGGVPLHTAPTLSKGEQMKKTRREKLVKESRKQVLAERLTEQVFSPEPAVARPVVAALLVDMVVRQLLRNRVRVDELTLAALQARYGWPTPPDKAGAGEAWVREQVQASAPQHDTQQLVFMLLFVTVNHDLGAEWADHQGELIKRLGLPELTEDLPAATEARLSSQYDPGTLRRLKQAA